MREIQLSPTLIGGSKEQPQYEENEAIPVYDTSGPYGDPQIAINVQQGLAKLRQPWIDARGDTEELTVRSSDYTKARLADDGLDELRFSGVLTPKRAKAGRRVTQLHYARQWYHHTRNGIHRHSREYGSRAHTERSFTPPASGNELWRTSAGKYHCGICP